ncbi:MAG: hypothetical protein HQ497_02355 [SAR86 cluster bacterium]|uniref:Uncharacterized protein n=1 Tax=SAR86 cluster bacterium TaxID=2030880 RepID=A0A972VW40_9GAMM|nr:hypothetical protein [SAR86 cluster bacterium]|tara:strand:- start:248 stop:583 length:336 start_codon:yes stop_codon:yes gene_type:complete
MPGELIPIIVVPAMFWMIAYITRVISDNVMRKHLLNKEVSVEVIDKVFLQNRVRDIDTDLKWGMIGIAIGLAFAVISLTGLSADEPMTYAAMFIFAGAGLLGFYAFKRQQQ